MRPLHAPSGLLVQISAAYMHGVSDRESDRDKRQGRGFYRSRKIGMWKSRLFIVTDGMYIQGMNDRTCAKKETPPRLP